MKTLRPLLLDLKGGAWTAIHIKGDLSGIFDFAILRGWCESNPVYLLRSLVQIPRSESKAALQTPQLRDFFKQLAGYRGWPETALALRLILLTAARPGEVAAAEWVEIDFEARLWRRPAAKMKARLDHISPLSDQAAALLQELCAITGNSAHLVPRRDGTPRPIDPARFAYAMRDLALAERASPHCFRATFSTWANERGFRLDAIEKQLAHVPRDAVRAAYDRSLLIDERRTMMQAWADYLTTLEAENVIVSHFGRAA
ncbi:MAG: site-specific integrase [Rhodocyclaceae bacterium]|nr:site-specific integrase [Rhodocyclaceae bacterium]